MASFEFLAVVVSILALAASITYYSMTIRNQTKTIRLELIKDIWDWISEEDQYKKFMQLMTMTWTSYEDFQDKYGGFTKPDDYAMRWSVWSKLNGLGYMVKEGAVDVESVYDHSASRVIWMWQKFESIIRADRERLGSGYLFKWWEYLAGELVKEAEKRGELLIMPHGFKNNPE